MGKFGITIIFGSGETSESGKAIHRHVFRQLGIKQKISVLETPAGFQPNSFQVASGVANIFKTSLNEFVTEVNIIPARKKGIYESPDNPEIIRPLSTSTFIFLGPGSPTYTVKQMSGSLAFKVLMERWKFGATLGLSSAAALAMSAFTLPVYEIYKAGYDLTWGKGLDLFGSIGLRLAIVTHWNNNEGGKDLDTRFCFMGEKRFEKLRKLLPSDIGILGIDEHTAIVFDFEKDEFYIDGVGSATFLRGGKTSVFKRKSKNSLKAFR